MRCFAQPFCNKYWQTIFAAMKVKKVEIYQSPIELKEPFITSFGADTHAENVVVVIYTDEGTTGWGECNPYLPICGENMQTAFVIAPNIAKLLLNKNPLLIEEHHAVWDKTIYANASIKSAFDIALYDIISQHAGLPLYQFLGGAKNKTLVTDYTVSLDAVDKMVSDAKKIVDAGFTVIKVKLGEAKDKDIERIRRIREAIGDDIPLRIDANQGWSVDTAIATLNALKSYNIQHCEEPIKRWNYTELPRVKKESPIPIMADESCCDHHDAKRLIGLAACDSFNIKLGKSAGIYKAMKIAALAEETAMKIQVGGFLESRIGFTASAHFALTSDAIIYCDFDTPLMFTEDPVSGGITYSKGGVVTVPDVPGLGASLDEDYMKGLKKIVVE